MAHKCEELWASLRGDERLLERISAATSDCTCEGHSASPHSPGPVSGSEILVRRLFLPIHFSAIRHEPTRDAYTDVYRRGLSVNRECHISEEELQQQAHQAIAQSPSKTGFAFAIAKCEHIRNMRYFDGSRIFCVYDTATRDDPSHADIVYSRIHEKLPKDDRRRIAAILAEVFRVVGPGDSFASIAGSW